MCLNYFILAFILASGYGLSVPQNEGVIQSELVRVKTLMAAFLKWVAQEDVSTPQHGHMLSPNLQNVFMISPALKSSIFVSYLKFVKITEAKKVVDHYVTDPKTLASSFRIRMPKIEESYRYKMNGTILSHNVVGEGLLTYRSNDITLTVSNLKFHDSPHNLQIASMKVDIDINNLIIEFTGLRVHGMDLKAFERVLQARVLSLLKEHLHITDSKAVQIEADIDTMMHGKSLDQIVHWLKQHTNSATLNYLSRFFKLTDQDLFIQFSS